MRLADLTTLRVGGPARHVVVAETEADLVAAVRDADATGTPALVVGGGSRIIVVVVGRRYLSGGGRAGEAKVHVTSQREISDGQTTISQKIRYLPIQIIMISIPIT